MSRLSRPPGFPAPANDNRGPERDPLPTHILRARAFELFEEGKPRDAADLLAEALKRDRPRTR